MDSETIRLSETCVTLKREMERQTQFYNIITQSKRMKAFYRLAYVVISIVLIIPLFPLSDSLNDPVIFT